MGAYAYLTACPSRDDVSRFSLHELALASESGLTAKYMIPLFWLAAFEPSDAVRLSETFKLPTGTETKHFILLCAPVEKALAQLRRRKSAVLDLVSERHSVLFDEWVKFVAEHYPQSLLLDGHELFGMGEYESDQRILLKSLEALRPADLGHLIDEREVFVHFTGVVDSLCERAYDEEPFDAAWRWRGLLTGWGFNTEGVQFWPPKPTHEEVEFARSKPAAPKPPPTIAAGEASQAQSSAVESAVRASGLLVATAYGVLGACSILLGGLFLWATLSGASNWSGVIVGALASLGGVSLLWLACRTFAKRPR